MKLDSFIGSENIKLSLSEAISADKLSHGLVIAGKKGFGVNYFARLLAADIVTMDPKEKDLVLKGESPLVQTISGEGISGQIKVSEIRKISDNVSFSSISGEKRVVIIQNCENFNLNSASALLKNLEEPKDDITYILTTSDISRLLATLRSRCGVYTLTRPTATQSAAFFNKTKDKKLLEELISIYDSNIGLIEGAIKDTKRLEILRKAIAAVDFIEKRDKYSLSKLLFAFNKKKEDFKFFLEDLEYLSEKNMSAINVKTLTAIHNLNRSFSANVGLALIMQNFVVAV